MCHFGRSAAARTLSSRFTPPTAEAVRTRSFGFQAWKGRTVRISVVDARDAFPETDALVRVTSDAITRAFARAGIHPATPGQMSLDVKILRYRADYIRRDGRRDWNGCVAFLGLVRTAAGQSHELPVDHCVKRPDFWGPSDGDEAVQQAYSEGLTELLSRADQLTN